jgi:hypothetical protein
MFPFIPDTLEVESFQSFTYQAININACYRYELEALPFLTPDQIDLILSKRPYKDWEDMLRKTRIKEHEVEYLKNFVYFGGERYYKIFLRVGSSGMRFSSSGKYEDLSYNLYWGKEPSFFFLKDGFFRLFFGNSKVFSPLGFTGYGGYYSNRGGLGFVYNSKPSLGFGLGKILLKFSENGLIGGYLGEGGGVLLTRSEVLGAVSYINYGPFSLEGALSKGAFGFGVKGYSKEGGFFIKIFRGRPFWKEGSQREGFSLWYRWSLSDFKIGFRISSENRRFYLNFVKDKGSLRVEYFQVPRISINYGGLSAGICKGCAFVGLKYRMFWVRLYSFTENGLKFYEDAYSSRVFTSKVGYRFSSGFRYKNFGAYISKDGNGVRWESWFFTTLR